MINLRQFWQYQEHPNESENRGLGDTVEEFINDRLKLNEIHMKMFNKVVFPWNWKKPLEDVNCGCDWRKWLLNTILPYWWRNK